MSGAGITYNASAMDIDSKVFVSSMQATGSFAYGGDAFVRRDYTKHNVLYLNDENTVEYGFVDANHQLLNIRTLPSGTSTFTMQKFPLGASMLGTGVNAIAIVKGQPEIVAPTEYYVYTTNFNALSSDYVFEVEKITTTTGGYSVSNIYTSPVTTIMDMLIVDKKLYVAEEYVLTSEREFQIIVKRIDLTTGDVDTAVDWTSDNDGLDKISNTYGERIPVRLFTIDGELNWVTAYYKKTSSGAKNVKGYVVWGGLVYEVFDFTYTAAGYSTPYQNAEMGATALLGSVTKGAYQYNRHDHVTLVRFATSGFSTTPATTDYSVTIDSDGNVAAVETSLSDFFVPSVSPFPDDRMSINTERLFPTAMYGGTGTWYTIDPSDGSTTSAISISGYPYLKVVYPNPDSLNGRLYVVASQTPLGSDKLLEVENDTFLLVREIPTSQAPAIWIESETNKYVFNHGNFFGGVAPNVSSSSGTWVGFTVSYMKNFYDIQGNNYILNIIEHN